MDIMHGPQPGFWTSRVEAGHKEKELDKWHQIQTGNIYFRSQEKVPFPLPGFSSITGLANVFLDLLKRIVYLERKNLAFILSSAVMSVCVFYICFHSAVQPKAQGLIWVRSGAPGWHETILSLGLGLDPQVHWLLMGHVF